MVWTLLVLLLSAPVFAEYRTQSFPAAHEIFVPLEADPNEPKFSFQGGIPVSHRGIVRIDVGDYLGIYRWALPGDVGAVQLNVGGAINTRFNATASHSLQVIDFYGNVPLDVRMGIFSMRLMLYHDSSHLGDDLLREQNIQSVNNSWEAFREVMSVQATKALRLYGGFTSAIHTKPAWTGTRALQAGAEMYFNPFAGGFWHPYWANDVQSWQRTGWDPTWVSQLGFKAGESFSKGRGITYFVQFKTGPRYEGQFYKDRETIWGVGLKFTLSDQLMVPTAKPEITQPSPVPSAPVVPAAPANPPVPAP